MSRSDASRLTKAHYYHPDRGDDPRKDVYEKADRAWMAKVQRFLVTNYALHHFCADIDSRQGYIKLYIPELMGAVNGYILHLSTLFYEADFNKRLHGACGEILERYQIPRARFDEADFAAALKRAPLNLQNAPVPE
tara:strand:+ start:605 stop:1012 length:408 start_codon:yes stop_codon:yes gene_type:complete